MEITLSPTDLFLIIAAVSIIVLMFFVVPLLVQLKKTAQRAENLIEDLDRDIPSILSSMKVAASEMEKLAALVPAIVELAGIGTGIKAFLHVIHRTKSKEKKEVQTNE